MNTRPRIEPVIDDKSNLGAVPQPESYERIQAVVELTRRLARQDFLKHLDAAAEAVTQEERIAANERLLESERAVRLADSAYQSLISSESQFRRSTVCLVTGDEKKALFAAGEAEQHLEIVSDKLDRFSDYAPRSRFFQKAIETLVRVDQAAGQLEDKVVKTVESFSRGLKAFAGRVRAFGAEVAQTPQRIKEKAVEAGVSTAAATNSWVSKMMGRVRSGMDRAAENASDVANMMRVTGWIVLEEAEKLAKRSAAAIGAAASAVDLHARATVGLAGGLMGKMASAVKEGYEESLENAEVKRNLRRATPR